MRTRLALVGLGWLALLGASAPTVYADDAAVNALGNASLVLEDKTTVLNLFNSGNVAGLGLLAPENHLAFSWQAEQRLEEQAFTTLPADQNLQVAPGLDANGNTVNYYYYPNLDANGNTLQPSTTFANKRRTFSIGWLAPQTSFQQGVFVRPADQVNLQFVPVASWQKLDSTDSQANLLSAAGGGVIRGAYSLLPNFALGAGFSGIQSQSQTDSDQLKTLMSGVEAGLALRCPEFFVQEDHLDLGLSVTGSQDRADTHKNTPSLLGMSSVTQWNENSRPLSAAVQGIYTYKSVMDISLRLAYEYENRYLSWADQELLSYALRNLDYEVQFRVRLPTMVREDDLRFGVTFNNHGVGNLFPTGTLSQLNTSTLQLSPDILTASSGIGIGTAIIPDEGSIIALQYSLGTTKSRERGSAALLADTGYSSFSFGAQYQLWKGFCLRAAYVYSATNSQSTYERLADTTGGLSTPPVFRYDKLLLTQGSYTRSVRLGVGLSDHAWELGLTGQMDSVSYSPTGWNIPGKPLDLNEVSSDTDLQLKGLASLTWMF